MFGSKKLPVGVLVLVLIIALAGLGLGYALWMDVLAIDGTVQTGAVDMAFSPCTTNDPGTSIDPGYYKHVANCECALQAGDLEQGAVDRGNDAMLITLNNGYPSYSCQINYDMTNIGTIPVHLENVIERFEPALGTQPELDYTQLCVVGDVIVEPGYQLHPNESVDCTITLHVNQEAEEGSTYTLYKEYHWNQYNESSFQPPSVEAGAPATYEKGFGVRYKSFSNTGSREVYLGVGDLGLVDYGVRVEADKTWTSPATYQVTFAYDKENDQLLETVDGGPDLTFVDFESQANPMCPPGEEDVMIITVMDRDPGTVGFNNIVLDGYSLPDLSGGDSWTTAQWTVSGFDFSESFTIRGDLELDGGFTGGDEDSKLELLVVCLP